MATIWQNRKALLSLVLMLCAAGAYTVVRLPVAIFPQLVVPRIVLEADNGDAPLQTTLATLTRPLETAVSTVPGVIKVSSTTTRGSTGLDVTFQDGTDMALALQRTQAQVAAIRQTLPATATVTTVLMNPSLFPIMGYSLTSDTNDLASLHHLARFTLRPRLARLPGVGQVRVTGGDVPEYLVAVDPAALAARGLAMGQVVDALARTNSVTSVGVFNHDYQRYEVLVSGLLHTADDIGAVTVATPQGTVPVSVAQVATVTRSVAPRTVLATGNGRPAVVVNIIKQPSANTMAVADEVRAALAGLAASLPPGVHTELFYDQSEIVRESESSVVEAITVGGILALLVLFLFLGNMRAAAVVLLVLPITLLVSFTLLRAMGMTLNIMTLGGIAIALGLVIDDGIVVVEDIFVGLEGGMTRPEAVAQGLKVITPGMIGSSLTTMAAFVPLTLVGGVTGQFFAPLALVMVATLGVSLVLALLLTPLFARYVLPEQARPEIAWLRFVPHQTERLGHLYGRVLRACLRHPWRVVLTLVPLLAASAWLYGRLETGFFPEFDEGAFVIDYFTPPGTSLEETDRIMHQVEDEIGKTPEVAAWSRLTGARSGSGLELTEPNQGDILVRLKADRARGAEDVMDDLRARLTATQPSLQIDLAQMLQDGIGDIAGEPQPIEVKLFGDDPGRLRDLAAQVAGRVGQVAGVVDVNAGVVQTGPECVIQVDSRRASRFGLSAADVTSQAMAALQGTVATTLQQGDEPIDVRVRAAEGGPSLDPARLPDMPLAVANGEQRVRLNDVATLATEPGQAEVTRENQQPMVAVTARLEGRDLGGAVRDIQAKLAGFVLPAGYRIEYGGLYASQQQSFMQLALVLLMAIMLISSLLLMQFRSFAQVIALMVASVLSMSGVLLALYLTGIPLNISSLTGTIMIIGVITENGVFLFDSFNSLPNDSIEDRLVVAGQHRLRPILMTKIGAILAMLPLALGVGAGAAMQQPLAVAVIGGLCVATFLTLLVAPSLYVLFLTPGQGASKAEPQPVHKTLQFTRTFKPDAAFETLLTRPGSTMLELDVSSPEAFDGQVRYRGEDGQTHTEASRRAITS